MNFKSLLFITAILVFAGVPLRSDSDIVLGPWLTNQPVPRPAPTDALVQYKAYVYQIVGSYWFPEIDRAMGTVPHGKVRVRFTVHSDGNITDVAVVEGKDQKMLAKISVDSLTSPAPFKPFDDALLKQVGQKYTDDFSFSTEDKK